jgi:hypothetical protein
MSQITLFDIGVNWSPEIKRKYAEHAIIRSWKQQNNIHTYYSPHLSKEEQKWSCWQGTENPPDDPDILGYGNTEKEAIIDFCKKENIQIWNKDTQVKDRYGNII